MEKNNYKANVERFSGFSEFYDQNRPKPPTIIIDILKALLVNPEVKQVVDLGCGTGLSTFLWTGHAGKIIGVEPNKDMRKQVLERIKGNEPENISFIEGDSAFTGLNDSESDIVTCSQALHWMEPDSTFKEVSRILKPGGIFAAYDADWPPTVNAEAEIAYNQFMANTKKIAVAAKLDGGIKYWEKNEHLERMKKSGYFRFLKEVVLHHIETGDAGRFVNIALSQGGVKTLLKNGYSEGEIGVEKFREIALKKIGSGPLPFYWSYRMRIGIK
jgi:ubiquinone/menaquinone biosynthesis C-methylase UbiE